MFVKVHFTTSPAATLKVARRFARLPDEFEQSSQTIDVRSQPALGGLVDRVRAGCARLGRALAVTERGDDLTREAERGSVTVRDGLLLDRRSDPCLVFVNVEVTVSPAATLNVALTVGPQSRPEFVIVADDAPP